MFLKHPCITKSQTAKLLLGAGRTIYAIVTRNCAAYLLVVSCLQNRTWWERNRRCETLKACFSAAFAKSGPLDFPSEKIFSFIFCPRKGLKTHVSKVVKLFSNSLFLRRHKPKMIFGQTTPVNSDRKCKFQRFCPARSDCNNVAHGILSCYKLQDVFS